MANRTIGPYEILEPLGSGGMGAVYLAEDARLRRRVALKLVRGGAPDEDLQRRMLREARTAAKLNHANICSVHEVGQADGETYIDMELVEGHPFSTLVSGERLPAEAVVRYGLQMADALSHAHEHGVVHGDFKSANVMVTTDDRVKVLDFGLARLLPRPPETDTVTAHTTFEADNKVGGTLPYMAPEQLEGQPADARSDVWALGVVLYEALAGQRPFAGTTAFQLTSQILRDTPAPLPEDTPPALAAIVAKCLEKNPRVRFHNAGEVKAALEATSWSQSQVGVTPSSKRRSLAPVAAMTLLAAAALAGLLWLPWPGPAGTSRSLAVLPFTAAANDADTAYLGGVIADGLIARLQQLPGVAVAPLSTAMGLGTVAAPGEAAAALDVEQVVLGSFTTGPQGQLSVSWRVGGTGGGRQQRQGALEGTVEQPDELIAALAEDLATALDLATPASAPAALRSSNTAAARAYLQAVSLLHDWDASGNVVQAIGLFQEALAIDDGFAAARAGLAMAQVRRYQDTRDATLLAAARIAAERAVADRPDLAEAYLARGMVATVSGESVQAEADLGRALELSSGNDAAYRSIADLQARAGRFDEARANFERAIELRPDFWENHYAYGSFLADYPGDLDEARVHLEDAARLHPEGTAALVERAVTHLRRGQLDQAEFYYEKALLRGADADAYSDLAYIHYLRGNYVLARDRWQEIIDGWGTLPDTDPHTGPHPAFYANLGDATRQLGDAAAAADYYTRALRGYDDIVAAHPPDAFTHAERGIVLASVGRCDDATAAIAAARAALPDNTYVLYYALQSQARCGRSAAALELAGALIDQRQQLLEMWRDPDLELLKQHSEVRAALVTALREEGLWRPTFDRG